MSMPMMKAEWLRVDEDTFGMNVPGGCVFRWGRGEGAPMVHVPMVAIVAIDGVAYLSSTLPVIMGEMMSTTGEMTEKILRGLDGKPGTGR